MYKIEHRQLDVKTGRVLTGGWEDWQIDAEGTLWMDSLEQAQSEVQDAQERNAYFVWTRLEFRVVEA